MKKAVVTGSNGFVGSELCRQLAAAGVSVIAVVRGRNAKTGSISDIPGIRMVPCDLSDIGRLPDLVDDRDIDAFFHLAWAGSAGPLRGDCSVQLSNARAACDAVKACAELGCRRFVFASSIMEYEIGALMNTETVPGINTIYSSAKVAADYMARAVAGSLGVDYIRAVISNIYGPGETSPRLINTSIRKLLAGEHCAFSAGEQLYDFIYITDAARSFVEIADKGRPNRTYYIGSQNPRPLKEFLCELRDRVDPELEIGLGELPFNGVSLSYREFDINAVKNDTGFVPQVSFSQGIQNTIQWIKELQTPGIK